MESIKYVRGQQDRYGCLSMSLNVLYEKKNYVFIAPKFIFFNISEYVSRPHVYKYENITLEMCIICIIFSLLFTGMCCL